MGFFSWKTNDTGRSVGNCYTNKCITVSLMDNKGNTWTEESYNGYGRFCGKDYYVLVAEMNGYKEVDPDDERGIQQLRSAGIDMSFAKDKSKYIFPNIVEDVENWKWVNKEPEVCEYQGYFYDDICEEIF